MMVFSTTITDENGDEWESDKITAISWKDAEHQAEMKGVKLIGQLREEQILDDEGNVLETINYDQIQNN